MNKYYSKKNMLKDAEALPSHWSLFGLKIKINPKPGRG